MARKSAKQVYKQTKEYIREMEEGMHERELMMIRQKMKKRWAEAQGCSEEEIDYTDPFVSLEWKLCDPAIRRTLKKGTDAEKTEILTTWTEAELDIYYNGDGGKTGTPYKQQIEDDSFIKSVGKGIYSKLKGKVS